MVYNYQLFLENIQQSKSILRSLKKTEQDPDYLKIRKMLSGKDGYVGLFTKLHFKDKVHLIDLESLLNIIISNHHIISDLPKNITEYDTYESIIDDIELVKYKYGVRKVYNQFPSEQKPFIDLNNSTESELLYQLYKRKDNNIFFKKVSSFHDKISMFKRIKSFLSTEPDKNFDDIISKIKQSGSKIIFNSKEDSIIICRIYTYKECKSLGSDTSWCIAGSEGTFRSYVPNELTNQFIIYLTDKDISDLNRKIGVTFNVDGYRTAHNIRDNHISEEKLKGLLDEYGFDISNLYVKKEDIKDFNLINVKSLLKVGFTLDEITERKSKYNSDDYDHITPLIVKKHNLYNDISVKKLLKIGCDETTISKNKTLYESKDLVSLSREVIDKYKLLDKVKFEGVVVQKMTGPEMEHRWQSIIPESLSIKDIMHIYPSYILKNKDVIISKMSSNNTSRNYYNNSERSKFVENFCVDKSKLKTGYDYRVGSSYSSDYSLDYTLYKLRFFMVGPDDIDYLSLADAFYHIDIDDFPKIESYLNMNGYGNQSNDDRFKFYDHIFETPSWGTKVEFFNTLIDMGIDCKKQFMYYINEKSRYNIIWDKNELSVIKKTFSEEELNKVLQKQSESEFIKAVKNVSIAAELRTEDKIRGEYTIEKFHNDWNNYVQVSTIPYGRDASIWIGVIYIYAKLNKLTELSNVQFNWKNKDFVHNLAKSLVGRWMYNSKKWIGLELNDAQIKIVYKWMMKYSLQISELSDISNTNRAPYYQMQVLFYKFDKPEFKDYLDVCSVVTNNSSRYGSNDKEIPYTFKIKNLTAIFNYLKTQHDYKGVTDLISEISKWKYTPTEKKLTHEWLVDKLGGGSNYTSDINDYKTNYKAIVDQYFKTI